MTPLAKKILEGLRDVAQVEPAKLRSAISDVTGKIQIGLMDTVHKPGARSTMMREALEEVLTFFIQKELEHDRDLEDLRL